MTEIRIKQSRPSLPRGSGFVIALVLIAAVFGSRVWTYVARQADQRRERERQLQIMLDTDYKAIGEVLKKNQGDEARP